MALYLAYDGGATRTLAALYTASGAMIAHTDGDGTNPTAYGLASVIRTLVTLGGQLRQPCSEELIVLCGLAGARTHEQRTLLGERLAAAFSAKRVSVTSDLHALLWANARAGTAIVAVAGTGSCVLAQRADGERHQVGGWGSALGDGGSAYQLALRALRAALRAQDGIGNKTKLTDALLAASGLPDVEAFIPWIAVAPKCDVAALAKTVADTAAAGDLVACRCVEQEATALAMQIRAAEKTMRGSEHISLFLHGGLTKNCAPFRETVLRVLQEDSSRCQVVPLRKLGHRAVFSLSSLRSEPAWLSVVAGSKNPLIALPATEQRLQKTTALDVLTAQPLVDRMNEADSAVPAAVAAQRGPIAKAVDAAAISIRQGGRILYVGAGTSGRLGVLDAAECPPTFGVATDRVLGIIAGGDTALSKSVEGAEDDRAQGACDLTAHAVAALDTVVGIAASGGTPYVHGALEAARQAGAHTVLVTCNPAAKASVDILIALETGAEVLPGSTRLKAGTATKLVLNMISTGALTLAGYVYAGLMIGMAPSNVKLRARAVRIVAELTGKDAADAEDLLDAADQRIAIAVLMGKRSLDKAPAEAALCAAEGNLRNALADESTDNQHPSGANK